MKIKYIFQVSLLFILIVQSCSSTKAVIPINKSFPILDSLVYVAYPDDNYLPSGNYYFQKVVSYGDSIMPYLIERIIDTTTTQIRIADFYNYDIGDIVIMTIPYVTSRKINIRDLMFEEFEEEFKGKDGLFFDQEYSVIFHLNSREKNYKNKVRFYERVKMWYNENKESKR